MEICQKTTTYFPNIVLKYPLVSFLFQQHLICPTKGHSSPMTFLMESQCPWLPVTPSSPKWASSLGLAVSSCTLYNREGRRPRVWGTRSYHSLCRINHQCHTKNRQAILAYSSNVRNDKLLILSNGQFDPKCISIVQDASPDI